MSKSFKIVCLVILIAGVLAYIFRPSKTKEEILAESVILLHEHFDKKRFESSGWSLKNIYVADGHLYVIVNFPPERPGKSRLAPVYSELIRHCPVAGKDAYWDNEDAQPFTIYLSGKGKSGAMVVIRCTRSLDKRVWDHIIETGKVFNSQLLVIPEEGESTQELKAAAEKGKPSFNQVKDAMNFNKHRDLQIYLNERPELVHLYDDSGTLLFRADTPEEVAILIGYGANPNVKVKDWHTVLSWVSQFKVKLKVIKLLIEAGADVSSVELAYVGSGKIAELLLKNGARISNNSLYEAVRESKYDVASVLYSQGGRLDSTTLVGSPLHRFIDQVKKNRSGTLESDKKRCRLAIKYSEHLDKKRYGLTALQYVESLSDFDGRKEIITLLRSHKAK